MIKNKLRHVLLDKDMTQAQLIELLEEKRGKFSRTSLVRFMDEEKPTVNLPLLDDICELLGVQPGEILVYEAEQQG